MKKILLLALISSSTAFAQNVMNTYAQDAWNGYVNVFSSDMNYEFGFQEDVLGELKTEFDTGNELVILYPNFILYEENETDATWVDQTTGEGRKIIEANTYVESNTIFNGQDLTFTGEVKGYTISPDYEVKYFIKALDPANNYQDALNQSKVFDLPASGAFSVSATAEELADGLIVQYGFAVIGRNANPDNEANLGNVVVGTLECDNYVVDATTSTSGITIEANAADLNYQWLDCDNDYAPIDGETNQSFTASENGNYAVEVTDGICADTSECVQISTVNLNELSSEKELNVYPNPAQNNLNVANSGSFKSFKIVDIQGKVMLSNVISQTIDINNLDTGYYFIHFSNGDETVVKKFTKI